MKDIKYTYEEIQRERTQTLLKSFIREVIEQENHDSDVLINEKIKKNTSDAYCDALEQLENKDYKDLINEIILTLTDKVFN
jgi:hypothetical protein